MKELIESIGAYNIFNYLLPGVLYTTIIENVSSLHVLPENVVWGTFVCYFIGMLISRIGSVILEPVLKKLNFVEYKNYRDFIKASKKDSKLEILSEQNNVYRTMITMCIVIGLTILYEYFLLRFVILQTLNIYVVLLVILTIFLYAYRKQTRYITKRIDKNLN